MNTAIKVLDIAVPVSIYVISYFHVKVNKSVLRVLEDVSKILDNVTQTGK